MGCTHHSPQEVADSSDAPSFAPALALPLELNATEEDCEHESDVSYAQKCNVSGLGGAPTIVDLTAESDEDEVAQEITTEEREIVSTSSITATRREVAVEVASAVVLNREEEAAIKIQKVARGSAGRDAA